MKRKLVDERKKNWLMYTFGQMEQHYILNLILYNYAKITDHFRGYTSQV